MQHIARQARVIGLLCTVSCSIGVHAQSTQLGQHLPPRPIQIGVIVPTSGRAREIGDSVIKGIELAILEKPSAALPPKITSNRVAEFLSSYPVDILIGPTEFGMTQEAMQAASANHIPIITLSQDSKATSGWELAYRAMPGVSQEIAQLVQSASTKKSTRIGVIYPSNLYGEIIKTAAAQHSASSGSQVVVTAKYNKALDADIREKLKIVAETRLDALLIAGSPEDVIALVPTLASLGLRIGKDTQASKDLPNASVGEQPTVQLMFPSAALRLSLIKSASRYFEGAFFSLPYFADSQEPQVQAFVSAYEARYHRKPDTFSALGYDCARIAIDGWNAPQEWPQNLSTSSLPTVTVIQGFDAKRVPRRETKIYVFTGGVLRPLQ